MHTTTTLCKQLRNTAFCVCLQHTKYTLNALDSSSTGPLQQLLTETLHMHVSCHNQAPHHQSQVECMLLSLYRDWASSLLLTELI